jgi:hypothetical protein
MSLCSHAPHRRWSLAQYDYSIISTATAGGSPPVIAIGERKLAAVPLLYPSLGCHPSLSIGTTHSGAVLSHIEPPTLAFSPPPKSLPPDQSYHTAVQRVTLVSVTLALMIPHFTFFGICGVTKLLLPRLVTWIATETQLNTLFSTGYPLFYTGWLLWKFEGLRQRQQDLEATPRDGLKRAAVRDLDDELSATQRQIEQQDRQLLNMLHYWIVCAAVATFKQVALSIPFSKRMLRVYPPLRSVLVQIEMAAWLWVHVVPLCLSPVYIRQLPNHQTPVEAVVNKVLFPVATVLHDQISSLIPASLWQKFVVDTCKYSLDLAVWTKALSSDLRDTLVELILQSRCLFLPAILLMTMWPLSTVGMIYMAYIAPMALGCHAAKHGRDADDAVANNAETVVGLVRWLQFWVLHTILTCLLAPGRGILAWIPLANLVIGCIYGLLAILTPRAMRDLYGMMIHKELLALSTMLEPPKDDGNGNPLARDTDSKLVQLARFVVEKLPRASEHVDEAPERMDAAAAPAEHVDDAPGHVNEANENGNDDKDDLDDGATHTMEEDGSDGEERLAERTPTGLVRNNRIPKENIPHDNGAALERRPKKSSQKRAKSPGKATISEPSPRRSARQQEKASRARLEDTDDESDKQESLSSSSSSYAKDTATSRARRRRTRPLD